MDEDGFITNIQNLLVLAKRGQRYDETIKAKNDLYNELRTSMNEKLKSRDEKIGKLYQENIQLKETHQDWESIMCDYCKGAGGFDDGHGGGCACHCDGGTVFVKKED